MVTIVHNSALYKTIHYGNNYSGKIAENLWIWENYSRGSSDNVFSYIL